MGLDRLVKAFSLETSLLRTIYTVFNYDVMHSMSRYIFDASKLGEYHDLNKEKGKPHGVFWCDFHR